MPLDIHPLVVLKSIKNTKIIKMNPLIVAIITLIISFSSYALDYNEYIFLNNSKQCNNYFNYVEESLEIPTNLLRSISVIETGRWHQNAKLYFTWPWTVNQQGKSYYFSSKNEAIEAVKKMLKSGLTNIDIGCMQINLHHHPEAFINLEEAFDPKTNIEYAANFLKRNYLYLNNWPKAVAHYHSQNSIGQEYAQKVLKMHNEYNDNRLLFDFCTSATGEIISCSNIQNFTQDNLPLVLANDNTNNIILSSDKKLPKNKKRLKSNMISYSVNN